MKQLDRMTQLVKESREADGLVRIEIAESDGRKAWAWLKKSECIEVHTKWALKVDVILDVFSAQEWTEELMRVIGGGDPTVQRVSDLMADGKEWVKPYRELRDRYAVMAKEAMERTGARGVSRVDWGL